MFLAARNNNVETHDPMTCLQVFSVCPLFWGVLSVVYLHKEVGKYRMDLGLIILSLNQPWGLRSSEGLLGPTFFRQTLPLFTKSKPDKDSFLGLCVLEKGFVSFHLPITSRLCSALSHNDWPLARFTKLHEHHLYRLDHSVLIESSQSKMALLLG